MAHRRSRADSATGDHRAAGLSSAQGLEAALSGSRLPDLYGPGTGTASGHRSLLSALGYRSELPRRKNAAGRGSGAGTRGALGRIGSRSFGRRLRYVARFGSASLWQLQRRTAATTQMGRCFPRPPNVYSTDDSSAAGRGLGPRPRYREFLRLRLQPLHQHEAGEMPFPPRLCRMLRQWMKFKKAKAEAAGVARIRVPVRLRGWAKTKCRTGQISIPKSPGSGIDSLTYQPKNRERQHQAHTRERKIPPGWPFRLAIN